MSDNHSDSTSHIPYWFWIVASLALVWNIMGVMAFVRTITLTSETLSVMSLAEQELYQKTPAWMNIIFAIATIGSALGCIALLLKKAVASYFFMVSFIAILIQMGNAFFIMDSTEGFGPGGIIMPILIIIVGFLLIVFSKKATADGWIN